MTVAVVAALGIGAYMIYKHQKAVKVVKQENASNPLANNPATGNQLQDIVKNAGETFDAVSKAFGGW